MKNYFDVIHFRSAFFWWRLWENGSRVFATTTATTSTTPLPLSIALTSICGQCIRTFAVVSYPATLFVKANEETKEKRGRQAGRKQV